MQNTAGDSEKQPNFISTGLALYRTHGVGVFWDGKTPKCHRAAINHSITFYVFEWLTRWASQIQ